MLVRGCGIAKKEEPHLGDRPVRRDRFVNDRRDVVADEIDLDVGKNEIRRGDALLPFREGDQRKTGVLERIGRRRLDAPTQGQYATFVQRG